MVFQDNNGGLAFVMVRRGQNAVVVAILPRGRYKDRHIMMAAILMAMVHAWGIVGIYGWGDWKLGMHPLVRLVWDLLFHEILGHGMHMA